MAIPKGPPPSSVPGVLVGVGIDIASVARIGAAMAGARGEKFRQRVFTPAEQAFCDGRKGADRDAAYAARFSAKEAFVKALGVPPGIAWLDVEVVRGKGAPRLVCTGAAERALASRRATTHLSLSHDAGVAVAVVIVTTGG